MPTTTVLTADATAVRDATLTLADAHGRDSRQRFVPLFALRTASGLPAWRFDRAAVELAEVYHGWLRVGWSSTAADDEASVRRNGQDYHLFSVDDWRGTAGWVVVSAGCEGA